MASCAVFVEKTFLHEGSKKPFETIGNKETPIMLAKNLTYMKTLNLLYPQTTHREEG